MRGATYCKFPFSKLPSLCHREKVTAFVFVAIEVHFRIQIILWIPSEKGSDPVSGVLVNAN